MLTFREIRELLYDAWGIAFFIWSAFTFYNIVAKGYVRFYEDNLWILWTEVGILCIFGVLAIERTVEDYIRILKNHGKIVDMRGR